MWELYNFFCSLSFRSPFGSFFTPTLSWATTANTDIWLLWCLEPFLRKHKGAFHNVMSSIPSDSKKEDVQGWLTALIWASEANSVPACFWALSYVLGDEKVKEKATAEAESVASSCGGVFSYEDYRKLKYIEKCVREAIRLRAPGMIVRKVIKDLPLGDYVVRCVGSS